jgi:hypothetical protein
VAEQQSPGKPFGISKMEVWWAWEKVRDNKGAAGIDGQSIADFERLRSKKKAFRWWARTVAKRGALRPLEMGHLAHARL